MPKSPIELHTMVKATMEELRPVAPFIVVGILLSLLLVILLMIGQDVGTDIGSRVLTVLFK